MKKSDFKRWWDYRKAVQDIYDFDYSSILAVEYFQLKRVRDCIAKYKSHVNADIDLAHMDTMLKLLKQIMEDDFSELKDGVYIPKTYTNTRNAARINKGIAEHLSDDKKGVWITYLKAEKVWQLYHKMRIHYLRNFWD